MVANRAPCQYRGRRSEAPRGAARKGDYDEIHEHAVRSLSLIHILRAEVLGLVRVAADREDTSAQVAVQAQ